MYLNSCVVGCILQHSKAQELYQISKCGYKKSGDSLSMSCQSISIPWTEYHPNHNFCGPSFFGGHFQGSRRKGATQEFFTSGTTGKRKITQNRMISMKCGCDSKTIVEYTGDLFPLETVDHFFTTCSETSDCSKTTSPLSLYAAVICCVALVCWRKKFQNLFNFVVLESFLFVFH